MRYRFILLIFVVFASTSGSIEADSYYNLHVETRIASCESPLSKDVFVDNAVEHYIENQPSSVFRRDSDGSYRLFDILTFDTIIDFKEANPNCCYFSDNLEGARLEIEPVFGYVTINNPLQRIYFNGDIIEYPINDVFIAMDSCGKPLSDGGFDNNTPDH